MLPRGGQVCSLVWSAEFKEIMSGHGFSYNQLTIWKYPQMTKVVDLTGEDSTPRCAPANVG